MGDIGLKISQPGIDVTTADDNELIFTSKYSALKIHSQGTGSHTFDGSGAAETITNHGLGYRPYFAVWVDTGDGMEPTPKTDIIDAWYINYFGTANTEYLYFSNTAQWLGAIGMETPLSDQEVDYAWIIFYDPIQDE